MTEHNIESKDIKVGDVFKEFYAVPDYQREYVWEAEQVEQLLSDINSEHGDKPDAPEYFIGSIVVCAGFSEVLELIDGQQRMTTIFLLLCAIRDRFKELGKDLPGTLERLIADVYTNASGNDTFRHRLELQYEDSGDVLKRIVDRDMDRKSATNTRSITNINNAYHTAFGFLKNEFGEDLQKIRAFYGYLITKVKLIRIQTKDVAKALKIFETINDRGVGLDSMDLLKNLLFMKADRDKFEKLKIRWKELQDTINEMREKPLRFLRYYIFGHYDVDVLREDEIYGWFEKNEAVCRYSVDPIGFADRLFRSVKDYQHFLNGRDQDGKRNRYLENLRLLGGKGARQHLILLLAGRHLKRDLFDQLAGEVENLFFIYVITREPTRNFERSFVRWAVDLRKVTNKSELQSFIARYFAPAKKELSVRFDDAFLNLHSGSVQQYRLRYILAKLTQYVELCAYGENEGTRWLRRYIESDYQIEHIFPQQPSQEAASEFGMTDDEGVEGVAGRLGNLLLIEKSINASLGNQAYSKKRSAYTQSHLLLTKTLAERPKIGEKTRIDKAVADLVSFSEWNETAINQRQKMLAVLAQRIWGIIPIV